MSKPRYRYNYNLKSWDLVVELSPHVTVFTGIYEQDGKPRMIKFPCNDPLINTYK